MPRPSEKWICCQLGSREHYAIPRVLHQEGLLSLLLTDFWARRPAMLQARGITQLKKLAERRHAQLDTAAIHDLGFRRVAFDVVARGKKWDSWETTLRRNEWFQHKHIAWLKSSGSRHLEGEPGIFFAYSYAARHLLRFFRDRGWKTILGQIDPGIEEENLVAQELADHPELATAWHRAPQEYWDCWREETALSDRILVNSPWSQQALIKVGVPEKKLAVLPLAFEKPAQPVPPRDYPSRFSAERPLRVLYLGQITARKGIRFLFEAAERLEQDPVEFWMVGPSDVAIPDRYAHSSRFRWLGPVSGSEAKRLYAQADIFILPTISDGFALTQLEAQAQRLPLIASRFCGQVVNDGRNGFLLDPLSGEKLTELLRALVAKPEVLHELEKNSGLAEEFSLHQLQKALMEHGTDIARPAFTPEFI